MSAPRGLAWESRGWSQLLYRGEHGRRLGEDSPGRRRGVFRCRLPGGLAGEQDEEEVPGLEEETAAGQAVRDPEEAGPGLKAGMDHVLLTLLGERHTGLWLRESEYYTRCFILYRETRNFYLWLIGE